MVTGHRYQPAESLVDTMKTHADYLNIQDRRALRDVYITNKVEETLSFSGIGDRLLFVLLMRLTVPIYVNNNEESLIEDFSTWPKKLAPSGPGLEHLLSGGDNPDVHLKVLLLHRKLTLL